ncbi:MAG: endonuclease domain-containing protein [Sphingomicrobium sp.]
MLQMARQQNPPRNGEGDHAEHGGGVDKRIRHRTVGASGENIKFARKLRRRMTLPEVLLWQQLRKRRRGIRFRRQFPCLGYVIDFACLERRLCIEVDGDAHSMGDRPQRDRTRDAALARADFETLRIAARDVLDNLDGVMQLISLTCANRPLHRSAAPSGPPPRSGED